MGEYVTSEELLRLNFAQTKLLTKIWIALKNSIDQRQTKGKCFMCTAKCCSNSLTGRKTEETDPKEREERSQRCSMQCWKQRQKLNGVFYF